VSKRRPSGSQPNTLRNDLRALIYLYLWADTRGMDLQDRFESGALLTLTEVADLDTFCGRYLEEAIAEFPGKAGGVIRLEVRNSKARRRAVNLVEKRNRLAAIHSFVEYTSADPCPVSTSDPTDGTTTTASVTTAFSGSGPG
jgi:hypothetical protein